MTIRNEDQERDILEKLKEGGEFKLALNRSKRHWLEHNTEYLFARLVEEVGELGRALIFKEQDPAGVKLECYDVANFVAFIVDKIDHEQKIKKVEVGE